MPMQVYIYITESSIIKNVDINDSLSIRNNELMRSQYCPRFQFVSLSLYYGDVKLPAELTDMRYSRYSDIYPKIYRYIVCMVISRRRRHQLQ